MGNIYIYEANADDFSNIGLVGALSPTECRHEEVANGLSEVTLVHPIDEWGRYAALIPDRILRVPVPVRTCPEIENGTVVKTFEVWTIKSTATKGQRYVYSKRSGGKKKKLLKAGTRVLVTKKDDNYGRYAIRYGGKFVVRDDSSVVSMKNGTSGWISKAALQFETSVSAPETPEGIEAVEPAWPVRDQLFRIVEVQKSQAGNSVQVRALRLFYDLRTNLTNYKNTGQVTASAALSGISSNCVVPMEFEFYTDIVGTRTGVDWSRVNPVKALLDDSSGFCARWGAQLVRDDWDIYCLSKAGVDRGIRIEYAKNLTGVECSENIEDVYTRIIPVGETKSGGELFLSGTIWVDSPLIGNYSAPRVYYLKCKNAKVSSSVTTAIARARMREQALAMFDDGCDKPALSISVDFVDLGDTAEYAQYRALENVFLYDTVHVIHPKLGIDVDAEVVRHVWDCLNERVLSVELGSVRGSLATAASAQAMVESRLAELQESMNDVVGLRLEIESTGDSLGAGIESTTLTAHVWRGTVDVTDEFDDSLFRWTRQSADPAGDAAWNAAHVGMKSVTLTRATDGVTATYQLDVVGVSV